jgi:hypothetical protein
MLAPSPSLPPKPRGFRPAGRVRIASRVNMARRHPDHIPVNRYKEGLKYEKKALTHLQGEFQNSSSHFCIEPCFRFSNGHRSRFCFPDAILLLPDQLFDVVIEIKTRHTFDGWWQLTQLYRPVVKKALQREVKLLEVVRSYDPGVALPEEETRVLDRASDVIGSNAPYNIYIWTGRF